MLIFSYLFIHRHLEYIYSEAINKNYEPDIWHPFEVSVVVPESRPFPNTSTVYGFRYSQFEWVW